MKIYLYSNTIMLPGGGTSTRITIEYLRKQGHKVSLFTNTKELRKRLEVSANNNLLPDLVLHHNILNLEKVYKIARKYSVPLIITINNLITDVNGLHIEQDNGFGEIILKPSFLKSFYLSLTQKRIHTKKNKILSIIFFMYRYLRKHKRLQALKKAQGVIVTGSTLKKLLIMHGVNRRIYVCPQPIDDSMLSNKIPPKHGKNIPKTSRYINPDYKHHILYVGGGEPFKGIHVLLKAFKQLALQDTTFIQDTELIIAGELRKAHKINPKNYPNNIKFLGEISYSSLKKLYSEVDFLVFPSLWLEAFGRAWAEALCIGCPVLAFKNRGGPSDYLAHNLTAYLAETSYSSLKHGIKELLENHVLRKKLTRNGKAYARKYLIGSAVARKLEKIYKEVLADNKSKLNTYNLTK